MTVSLFHATVQDLQFHRKEKNSKLITVKENGETKRWVKEGKSYGRYIPFVCNMLFLILIFKHLGVEEAFQGERSLRKDKAVSLKSLVMSR